jgi:hypothetical protein
VANFARPRAKGWLDAVGLLIAAAGLVLLVYAAFYV